MDVNLVGCGLCMVEVGGIFVLDWMNLFIFMKVSDVLDLWYVGMIIYGDGC